MLDLNLGDFDLELFDLGLFELCINSEDLDPKTVKIVDENFWQLLMD